MPVTLTKAQLNKLLQEERQKTHLKNRNSRFMTRTLSCYNGQKSRAAEVKVKLHYDVGALRERVAGALGKECPYGGGKISIANFAVDHDIPIARGGSWELSNLVVSTTVGNFRKGQLTGKEWKKFDSSLRKHFAPAAVTDIFRRLTLGGKWSFGR